MGEWANLDVKVEFIRYSVYFLACANIFIRLSEHLFRLETVFSTITHIIQTFKDEFLLSIFPILA